MNKFVIFLIGLLLLAVSANVYFGWTTLGTFFGLFEIGKFNLAFWITTVLGLLILAFAFKKRTY